MKNNFVVRMVLVLAFGLAIGGCGKKAEEPAPAPAAPKTTERPKPAAVDAQEADVLQPFVKPAVPATEADQAWAGVEAALELPAFPPEWVVNPPSEESVQDFLTKRGSGAAKAADAARDFYTKYPKHEKAIEARAHEMEMLAAAIEGGQTNLQTRLLAAEEKVLQDPNLPEDDRFELRKQQIERLFATGTASNVAGALSDLEKNARALQKEFPKRDEVTALLVQVANMYLDHGDVPRSRTLAEELLKSDVPPEAKTEIESLLKKSTRLGKPVEIKFKAVDGREVDVQAMKGKVVLVDFWATWCGPCMAELPKVKAAYEKLHGQGFEIVGISFDQQKDALLRALEKEKMTWPQYLEEAGAENKFGEEFGISGIPAMWLIDKKGVLRDLNAREDLAAKVEKLLAE